MLTNFSDLLRGRLWLHFIDNSGALAALVEGSSSVTCGDVIVGETWRRIIQINVLPWFDRADSKSNPVDGLSRGAVEEQWTLILIVLPDCPRREL